MFPYLNFIWRLLVRGNDAQGNDHHSHDLLFFFVHEEGRGIARMKVARAIFHGGRKGRNTSGAVPERLISKWRHLSVEADTYVLPGLSTADGGLVCETWVKWVPPSLVNSERSPSP